MKLIALFSKSHLATFEKKMLGKDQARERIM